jgi:hypothetical protein
MDLNVFIGLDKLANIKLSKPNFEEKNQITFKNKSYRVEVDDEEIKDKDKEISQFKFMEGSNHMIIVRDDQIICQKIEFPNQVEEDKGFEEVVNLMSVQSTMKQKPVTAQFVPFMGRSMSLLIKQRIYWWCSMKMSPLKCMIWNATLKSPFISRTCPSMGSS